MAKRSYLASARRPCATDKIWARSNVELFTVVRTWRYHNETLRP